MKLLLTAFALASSVLAAPFDTRQTTGACASPAGDSPYSLNCAELASRVEYPRGDVGSKDGGIVFLVHGTGSQGGETWKDGPYNTLLPTQGPGYDIAWFNSPTRSLGDAQVNAEYIAFNIKALAAKSKTGKVFVISHSQGSINVQWALAFFPSARQYVSGFISIAGDFKGTILFPVACTAQQLLQGGCAPSVHQQSTGSEYLGAQNRSPAGSALVNTLALYTTYDDIVQPQGADPSSALPGATNVRVQDLCTPAYIVDHFGITVAAPAYYATLQFLLTGSFNRANFNAIDDCSYIGDNPSPDLIKTAASTLRQLALDAIALVTYQPKVRTEPKLMRYVCDSGAATTYCN